MDSGIIGDDSKVNKWYIYWLSPSDDDLVLSNLSHWPALTGVDEVLAKTTHASWVATKVHKIIGSTIIVVIFIILIFIAATSVFTAAAAATTTTAAAAVCNLLRNIHAEHLKTL